MSVMISGPPSSVPGPRSGEGQRHVVVGVQAGGDDDVQVGGRRDAGDPRDVAAQPDHREVDDGVHAARLELVEPVDRVGHALRFVAPRFGVVLRDLGVIMKTCSCMSVTPRSAVSMAPRAVFSCGTPPMLPRPPARRLRSAPVVAHPRNARRSRPPTATGFVTAPRRPGSGRPRWCRR